MWIENSCLLQGACQMHWISSTWGDGQLSSQCTWNTLVVCALHSIHLLFNPLFTLSPHLTHSDHKPWLHNQLFQVFSPSPTEDKWWLSYCYQWVQDLNPLMTKTLPNCQFCSTTYYWLLGISPFFRSRAIWDRGWVAMFICRWAIRAHTTLKTSRSSD